MDYKAPFLALPDVRKNLLFEFIPGSTLVQPSPNMTGEALSLTTRPTKTAPARINAGLIYPAVEFDSEVAVQCLWIDNNGSLNPGASAFTLMLLLKMNSLPENAALMQLNGIRFKIFPHSGTGLPTLYLYTLDLDETAEEESEHTLADPTDDFHFLTFMFDTPNAHCKIYQDLTLLATRDVGGPIYGHPTTDLYIGNVSTASAANNPDFQLAYLRYHATSLTLAEITQIQQLVRRKIMGRAPKL